MSRPKRKGRDFVAPSILQKLSVYGARPRCTAGLVAAGYFFVACSGIAPLKISR